MKKKITFMVKGSADEPYRVMFVREAPGHLAAFCTCPAGKHGQYCKHRFKILKGSWKGIVSDNQDDVRKVKEWLPGTRLETAMQEVEDLQAKVDKLKRRLSAAKKQVAEAMHG